MCFCVRHTGQWWTVDGEQWRIGSGSGGRRIGSGSGGRRNLCDPCSPPGGPSRAITEHLEIDEKPEDINVNKRNSEHVNVIQTYHYQRYSIL